MATMQAVMLTKKGVEAAFDSVGGVHTGQCVSSTRRGGAAIWYGFAGVREFSSLVHSLFFIYVGALLRGRRGSFYGITMLYRKNPQPFLEGLPKLFELLAQNRISPRIAGTYHLLDACKANERLEAGGINGKLMLTASGCSSEAHRPFEVATENRPNHFLLISRY